MSRTRFPARAIFSAATLTAMLLGTACSDSTGPSTEEGSADLSPTAQISSGTGETTATAGPGNATLAPVPMKQSSLVQTGSWAKPPWLAPGKVDFAQPSVTGFAALYTRSVNVTGIRVHDIPGTHGMISQTAVADVYVWRYNGTSWGTAPYASRRVAIAIPQTSYFNSVVLPSAAVNVVPGCYRVTVTISWISQGTVQAYRRIDFNSVTDYGAFGAAARGPGYVTIN